MLFSDYFASKDRIRVAALGGSITQGTAATDPEKGYVPMLGRMLRNAFPKTRFHMINGGMGGTGSLIGYFRMDYEILDHDPDLLIIEFAVNDDRDTKTSVCVENIIRHARGQYPSLPIILFFTTEGEFETEYANGRIPMAVAEQTRIAEYYGIPTVNGGLAVHRMLTEGARWEDLIADGCHPNDAGHLLYAETLCDFMKTGSFEIRTPEPLCREFNSLAVHRIENAGDNWEHVEEPFVLYAIPDYYRAKGPGAALSFRFRGNMPAAYYSIERDNNNVRFRIDGGKWYPFGTFDRYALDFRRPNIVFFPFLMPKEERPDEGEHLLELEVTAEKDPLSDGGTFRVGTFYSANIYI